MAKCSKCGDELPRLEESYGKLFCADCGDELYQHPQYISLRRENQRVSILLNKGFKSLEENGRILDLPAIEARIQRELRKFVAHFCNPLMMEGR